MSYFSQYGDEYVRMIFQHIAISASAILIASLIGIILGILASHSKVLEKIFVGLFSTLRIIPSLAILFVLVPLIGTGLPPTIVALVILAFPPILINTIEGIKGVDDSVLEAAKGMGMDRSMIFRKVTFPLAFPVIFSGIRSATVEVIASATLASYIGGGGLGDLIFTGLGLMRFDMLWIGGLTVAALSLLTSFILAKVDKHLRKYEAGR